MSPSSAAVACGSRTGLLSATYQAFRRLGFDESVAANLTAVSVGVPVGHQPWKVEELTHLVFLHELGSSHAEWSGVDDRALADVGDGWRLAARSPDRTDPSDGRVTLLTIFRSIAGPHASPDFFGSDGLTGSDDSGDVDGERR